MAENEIVTVEVTLTRREFAAALRAITQSGSPFRRILYWVSIVFLCFMFYRWLQIPDRPWVISILSLVLIAVFVLFMVYGVPFLSARSFVKKNPDKLGPAIHSVGPDGISNRSRHGESKLNWSAYLRIKETPRFFLLYAQSNFAQIVPKRCFENPAEVERYRQVLRTYYKGKLQLLA